MDDSQDDGRLLAAVREAVAARDAVPAAFTAAARAAYAWHRMESELARLVYDSGRDPGLAASVRSESAPVRSLTLDCARFTVELELTGDALVGQLLPPHRGAVELRSRRGRPVPAPIDEAGGFVIEPGPGGPFRLRLRAGGQPDVLTGWLAG